MAIADFLLTMDGVDAFKPPKWLKDFTAGGTDQYFARRAATNADRTLFLGDCGTKGAGDLGSVASQIIASMRQASGGLDRNGIICLFGSSNGAAAALALAIALQPLMRIQYICLSDLPLFTGGRSPAIPGAGSCAPTNPQTIRRAFSLAGSIDVLVAGDHPKFSLDQDVNASLKQNFFQQDGNTTKFGLLSGRIFWTSDMANGEVHGECINSGWNRDQEVTGIQTGPLGFFQRRGDALHRELNDHVQRRLWGKTFPVELAKF